MTLNPIIYKKSLCL